MPSLRAVVVIPSPPRCDKANHRPFYFSVIIVVLIRGKGKTGLRRFRSEKTTVDLIVGLRLIDPAVKTGASLQFAITDLAGNFSSGRRATRPLRIEGEIDPDLFRLRIANDRAVPVRNRRRDDIAAASYSEYDSAYEQPVP